MIIESSEDAITHCVSLEEGVKRIHRTFFVGEWEAITHVSAIFRVRDEGLFGLVSDQRK